jgi:hypothetical protein
MTRLRTCIHGLLRCERLTSDARSVDLHAEDLHLHKALDNGIATAIRLHWPTTLPASMTPTVSVGLGTLRAAPAYLCPY